ncbi:hypothetical protein E2C01_093117 [Portunus trituberculatus]|uniref:Uncharacterized protein n=1 Tax=Portunus trituberculatus TaxID=210409 RepID=A0A5B7JT67_PORTR|nr:hypothetical protein [Portunus trituberculatus]
MKLLLIRNLQMPKLLRMTVRRNWLKQFQLLMLPQMLSIHSNRMILE